VTDNFLALKRQIVLTRLRPKADARHESKILVSQRWRYKLIVWRWPYSSFVYCEIRCIEDAHLLIECFRLSGWRMRIGKGAVIISKICYKSFIKNKYDLSL